jgi:hypothetical protein
MNIWRQESQVFHEVGWRAYVILLFIDLDPQANATKTLKSSKIDQRLKSVTLIIRRQVDKLICPIESLRIWFALSTFMAA